MPVASQILRELFPNVPCGDPGEISEHEAWWVERQQALEQVGYMLRPRFRLGWKPSWAGTDKNHRRFEDGIGLRMRECMDAIRISDERPVMLKRLPPEEEGLYELDINKIFSTASLSLSPRNHCVPLLDVIRLPDDPPIVVNPLLRPFYDPRLQTFGEFVTFFSQICEGVQFMHENNIAHRNCTAGNIMLDPSNMYPNSFHPADIKRSKDFRRKAKRYSRTWRPSRYLLVDFGLSRLYLPANGPPLDDPVQGGDKSAPEHQNRGIRCNPFPTDVYYLGNLIREDYIQVYHFLSLLKKSKYGGFAFIKPLIADMVQEDPTKRPTMDEVVARFADIRSKLSTWKLRSRVARKNEIWPVAVSRTASHWYRTVAYVLTHKAPIPEPE
ncbi:kinase-like domain-containing protein [Lactifluus volemus]|nr:kinase-like domain-containing protein [Lactifluus volemus]